MRKMKREGKKVNEDEFSLQTDNEVRCINGKDSILISPIFEWTERDVWTFLNEVVRVPHCELYDQGYKRIGCILCPMSQYRQKVRELKDFPHVKRGWIRAIKAIRAGGVSQGECTSPTMSDHQWRWDDGRITPPRNGELRTATSGGTSQPVGQQGMSAECSEIGNGTTPAEWAIIRRHKDGKSMAIGQPAMQLPRTTFRKRYGRKTFYKQFTPTADERCGSNSSCQTTQNHQLQPRMGEHQETPKRIFNGNQPDKYAIPVGDGTERPTAGSGRVFRQPLC